MDMPGDINAWYLHEDSRNANVKIPTSGKFSQKWGTLGAVPGATSFL